MRLLLLLFLAWPHLPKTMDFRNLYLEMPYPHVRNTAVHLPYRMA